MKILYRAPVSPLIIYIYIYTHILLPGSIVYGILQARILEWVAISFSWGSSQAMGQIWVSYIVEVQWPLYVLYKRTALSE